MKILISQKEPSNLNAYNALEEKYGAAFEFHPFFLIEPLSAKEFRSQRINLPDYTAVVFSSRHAIDAYFKLCEEMRFKVPETMKYFCSTELVALYMDCSLPGSSIHGIFQARALALSKPFSVLNSDVLVSLASLCHAHVDLHFSNNYQLRVLNVTQF